MGEIKPGILALVISSNGVTNNVGKVVMVERLVQPGEPIGNNAHYVGTMPVWLCTGEGVEMTCQRPDGNLYAVASGRGYFPPFRLMPINPQADPLEKTQQQEKTA